MTDGPAEHPARAPPRLHDLGRDGRSTAPRDPRRHLIEGLELTQLALDLLGACIGDRSCITLALRRAARQLGRRRAAFEEQRAGPAAPKPRAKASRSRLKRNVASTIAPPPASSAAGEPAELRVGLLAHRRAVRARGRASLRLKADRPLAHDIRGQVAPAGDGRQSAR